MTPAQAAQLAEKHVRGQQQVDYCSQYGEPGYTDPSGGILFADWNDCPKWLLRGLERRGFELEWSDEWQIIIYENDCKAYRTSPDSYGWTPSYVQAEEFCDGDMVSHEEIQADSWLQEKYIEYLLNNQGGAAFSGFDLAGHGFTLVSDEYETGLHPGQTDDPKKTLADLRARYPSSDFIFSLDSVGQFDCNWSAWRREVMRDVCGNDCSDGSIPDHS